MYRATIFHPAAPGDPRRRHESGWASAAAILFAVVAVMSLAMELIVTLSAVLPEPPRLGTIDRR